MRKLLARQGRTPRPAWAVLLALTTAASAAAIRDLGDGESLPRQAAFVAKDGEHIILKLASGTTVRVPAKRFSGAELEFIAGQSGELAEGAKAVNQALGFPAFTGLALAGRAAADLAKALELPLESDAPVGKSWRLYAAVRKPGYKLFGAVPTRPRSTRTPKGRLSRSRSSSPTRATTEARRDSPASISKAGSNPVRPTASPER